MNQVNQFFNTDPKILGFIKEEETGTDGPKAQVSVPVLELARGGPNGAKMLYSDKSVQKLALNDSTKYDKKLNVVKDYQETCNRSIYLLNDKYRFKKYKEFDEQDKKKYVE